MPKKTLKKVVRARKLTTEVKPAVMVSKKSVTDSLRGNALLLKLGLLGLLVLALGFLVYKNKGLFVAATVNGQPLWRMSLDSKLVSQYGPQTVDEMVGEMLIRQAASAKKVSVSSAEVDAKLTEIEKSLNGQITLKDALAQQGDTVESFRQRIELQLLLEKLTAGQVTVSEQEITDYVDKNKTTLTASDEAGMRAEAKQAVFSQKQNDVLRQYFNDLKAKAKVSKYL